MTACVYAVLKGNNLFYDIMRFSQFFFFFLMLCLLRVGVFLEFAGADHPNCYIN